MSALAWGSLSVAVAFLLHLAWWRIRIPVRQTRSLLLLFGLVFVVVLVFGSQLGPLLPKWFPPAPATPPERFHAGLLVLAMTLGYGITYSALEADSPSLVIVLEVAAAGPEGLPEDQLRRLLGEEVLVDPRLADLVRDRLATWEAGRLRITGKGRRFLGIFRTFRRLLGAGKGG